MVTKPFLFFRYCFFINFPLLFLYFLSFFFLLFWKCVFGYGFYGVFLIPTLCCYLCSRLMVLQNFFLIFTYLSSLFSPKIDEKWDPRAGPRQNLIWGAFFWFLSIFGLPWKAPWRPQSTTFSSKRGEYAGVNRFWSLFFDFPYFFGALGCPRSPWGLIFIDLGVPTCEK